jgi:hypothetical protein
VKELKIPLDHIKDGFAQARMSSFSELLEYEEFLTKKCRFVFRGQEDPNWPLQPKLIRQYPTITDAEVDELTNLYNVKMNLRLTDKNKILARGQHNGLWTPLLDFTYDLKIALFFAFENATNVTSSEFVSVWALWGEYNLTAVAPNQRASNPALPPLVEYITVTDSENHRLVNQRGLFVKCPTGSADLKEWCQQYVRDYDRDKKTSSPAILIQFLLPGDNRNDCLKSISKDFIKPQLLFPEDDGIVKMINLSRDIKEYL